MNKVVNNISKYSFTQHYLNSAYESIENIQTYSAPAPAPLHLIQPHLIPPRSIHPPLIPPCFKRVSEPKVVKNDFFTPQQKDTLFWCLYIIKHGFTTYDMLGDKHFSNEKIEKFNYIEMLRKNKATLKENKIKPLSEIEDNIANSECISIKTLSALALLEKINIIIIFKKTYCEFDNNIENPTHIIHKIVNKYKYELDSANIQSYKDNYLKIISFENPLMPISSYKISELVELCAKIGITEIKQSKSNLYQLIITNIKN